MGADLNISELAYLVIEVRERAEAVPRFGQIMLRNFEQVEETVFNLVGMARSHPLNHCLQPMQPTAWTSLEQLHDLLDHEGARLDLADEQKTDLLQQVTDLMVQVRDDPDLDEVQRSTMLGHLLQVEASLLNIDIGGPKGVENAVDGLMGGLVRLSIRTRAFARHPVTKATLRLIGVIAAALSIAADLDALTAGGFTQLLLEQGGSDQTAGGADGGGSS